MNPSDIQGKEKGLQGVNNFKYTKAEKLFPLTVKLMESLHNLAQRTKKTSSCLTGNTSNEMQSYDKVLQKYTVCVSRKLTK